MFIALRERELTIGRSVCGCSVEVDEQNYGDIDTPPTKRKCSRHDESADTEASEMPSLQVYCFTCYC